MYVCLYIHYISTVVMLFYMYVCMRTSINVCLNTFTRALCITVCVYACMYVCGWTAYLDSGVLHVRVYLLVCGEYAELVLVDARTAGRGYRVQEEFHVLRILHQAPHHNLGMYVCMYVCTVCMYILRKYDS